MRDDEKKGLAALAQPEGGPLPIGVLASGRGTNLRALLSAIEQDECLAEVRVVISDRPDSGALQLAKEHGITAQYVAPGRFMTKLEPDREAQIVEHLQKAEVRLVLLAGWMRVVKETLLEAFPCAIINVHPSLLPKYPGLEAWKQALEGGERQTGATIHLVDEGLDTGPILAQRQVNILEDDTADSLYKRIQDAENTLLPWVIDRISRGEIGALEQSEIS